MIERDWWFGMRGFVMRLVLWDVVVSDHASWLYLPDCSHIHSSRSMHRITQRSRSYWWIVWENDVNRSFEKTLWTLVSMDFWIKDLWVWESDVMDDSYVGRRRCQVVCTFQGWTWEIQVTPWLVRDRWLPADPWYRCMILQMGCRVWDNMGK